MWINVKYGLPSPHICDKPGAASSVRTTTTEFTPSYEMNTLNQTVVYASLWCKCIIFQSTVQMKWTGMTNELRWIHKKSIVLIDHLGRCTHTLTPRISSRIPWPFHCCAACSSSVQTPTIYRTPWWIWHVDCISVTLKAIFNIRSIFEGCCPHRHKIHFELTWRNATVPNGVWIGCIWGSSVSNICWIRDSLLSSGLCHDTWSPLQNVFSKKKKRANIS